MSDEELKGGGVDGVVFGGCCGNNSGGKEGGMGGGECEGRDWEFCNGLFGGEGECENYGSMIGGCYEGVKRWKGVKSGGIVEVEKKGLGKALEKGGVVGCVCGGF